MADLSTTYMGLQLRNPVVASAGPLSQTADGVCELAAGGVGAVVMYSLFEEQLRREAEQFAEEMADHEDAFVEAQSWFPDLPGVETSGVDRYVDLVERAAKAIDVPLIASINGSTTGSWVSIAKQLEQVGAAGLELNIYMVPGDLDASGQAVEDRHVEILRAVKEHLSIPVAVKLSPFFSSTGAMCRRLDEAGADALVLFNRFLQPDIDIDRMEMVPGVWLSSPADARLPRTWIAVLQAKVTASLAATSGVDQPEDVVKYILAGADVVMTTSALLRHGPAHASVLVHGLDRWLDKHGLDLASARGMLAVPSALEAGEYERAGYVAALERAKSTWGSLV